MTVISKPTVIPAERQVFCVACKFETLHAGSFARGGLRMTP
jgi:hypothetical protein